MDSARTSPTVLHLSLAPVKDDGRVGRSIAATRAAGARVAVLAPGAGLPTTGMTGATKLRMALGYGGVGRYSDRGALLAYWSFRQHRVALKKASELAPALVYAHDWDALPIAEAASRRLHIPFIFDSHEYAVDMFKERRLWSLAMPGAIGRLERRCAQHAAAVVTVSQHLADALQDRLSLAKAPLVIRNVPEGDLARGQHAVDPERITLHYHGALAEGRGLDTMLDTLRLLPRRFCLRVTGPWRQEQTRHRVEGLAKDPGLADRVSLHPAVPIEDLVKHASQADIGLMLLAGNSVHNRGALPNKFFEYLQAGLMVVCSGSQAMRSLIDAHRCGLSFAEPEPASIANALSRLSVAEIEAFRFRARQAGMHLTWQSESRGLEDLLRRLLFDGELRR